MFLPISVRIIGEEYKDKEYTGKEICFDRGINMYFNSRNHRFSSTELRQRAYQSELSRQNV
jgi:glycerol-3-phosphate cytidylyltransferase